MKTTFGIGMAATMVTSLIGCSSTPQESGAGTQQQALVTAGIPALRISRPSRPDGDVSDTLLRLANALGTRAEVKDLRVRRDTISIPGRTTSHSRHEADIGTSGRLKGRYESRDDSFEAFDLDFRPDSPAASDLSLEEATKLFQASYARLVAAGLVHPSRVRISDVVVRHVRASEGNSQGGVRRRWLVEHVFFVPTTIEGIPVGTASRQYGLSVGVHRTGQVRRIEISGAAIAAGISDVVSVTRTVARAERKASPESAVRAALGDASVTPLGLRYVVDEDVGGGELVARELFGVIPVSTDETGRQVRSKEYVASYSIDDAGGTLEFSPPIGFSPTTGNQK